jgi:hypothetical protein
MKKNLAWIAGALMALAVGCAGSQKPDPGTPPPPNPSDPTMAPNQPPPGDPSVAPPPANPDQPQPK